MRGMIHQRAWQTATLAMLLLASSGAWTTAQEDTGKQAPADAEPGAAKGRSGKTSPTANGPEAAAAPSTQRSLSASQTMRLPTRMATLPRRIISVSGPA